MFSVAARDNVFLVFAEELFLFLMYAYKFSFFLVFFYHVVIISVIVHHFLLLFFIVVI